MSRPSSSNVLIVAVTAIIGTALACAGATGLLGEMVPWPTMTRAVPVNELSLSPVPPEALTTEEANGSEADPLYGLLPLGSSSDPGILFSVTPGKPPRLLFDTDNDEDLSDEQGICKVSQIDARSYTWSVTVKVEYADPDGVHSLPYQVLVAALYDYALGGYQFGFSGSCQRRGLIELAGQLRPISITTLRSDGLYSDPDSLIVVVDVDGDGVLNDMPGSHEVFGPGEPVQIGETLYAITEVGEDGQRIVMEPSGTALERPVIARGRPAPLFATSDLEGQAVALESFRGEPVVLLFVPSLPCQTCGTAFSGGDSSALARLADLVLLLSSLGGGLETVPVIAVLGGGILPKDAPSGPNLVYVNDPSIQALYRRTYGAFVVDPEGSIVAMDEAWSKVRDAVPYGFLDELHAFEIAGVLQPCIVGNGG